MNCHHSQHGFNLIELMIGVALGLMLMVSLGYILLGGRSSFQTQDANSRVQETGRLVLDTLTRDLRLAGRVSIIPVTTDERVDWPAGTLPLGGAEGGGSASDTLTVRFQLDDTGGGSIEDCNGNAGGTLVFSNITGTSNPSNTNNPFRYAMIVNQYSVAAGTLSCLGNGANASQPLADNVDDFQVTYGEDTDSDYAPNQYLSAANVSTWEHVVSVRVCALIRSENGAVSSGQPYTDCSGNNTTQADTRLRRAFTTVVNLRNRNKASQ
ncbi:MAG: PilW family protein [Betaproteobacteria bacterium]|nr:PilW family protein [Betaproteobacteria bacterium]